MVHQQAEDKADRGDDPVERTEDRFGAFLWVQSLRSSPAMPHVDSMFLDQIFMASGSPNIWKE